MRTKVIEWLETWSSFIKAHDFQSASKMFDPAVFGFGTVTIEARGIDELVKNQWQPVWGRTLEFNFNYPSMTLLDIGDHCLVGIRWESFGINSKTAEKYLRKGRATILLRAQNDKYICTHTHFSRNPEPEPFL